MAYYGNLSVTSAAAVPVPAAAGSSVLISRPAGGVGTLYVGWDSSVTTANGTPVAAGQAIGLAGRPSGAGPNTGVYLISDQVAGVDVRWLQGTY